MSCFEKLKTLARTLLTPYRKVQAWHDYIIELYSSLIGVEREHDETAIKDKINMITPLIQDAYTTCFNVFKLFVSISFPVQTGILFIIKDYPVSEHPVTHITFLIGIACTFFMIISFATSSIDLSLFCKKYILYKYDIKNIISEIHKQKKRTISSLVFLFLIIILTVMCEICFIFLKNTNYL